MSTTVPVKKSVLFVCLGNICRSPMAEIVFRALVAERDLLDHWHIDSAGTSAYHIGEAPDERSVETCSTLMSSTVSKKAHDHFKSLKLHRARQLVTEDFSTFDYIFAMDGNNLTNIKRLNERSHHQKHGFPSKSVIKRIGEYHPEERYLNVEDPYYGDMSGFKVNYQQLLISCTRFLDEVQSSSS
ncbi:hypothetical protein SAMD00019534_124580, partial [Acytostelium subglobosum LB1]|uniref:hypothetical protein n=1 Tax=Acytostelium subglobosum LB1 TaxID=1410327 RepID=UPI000644BBB9